MPLIGLNINPAKNVPNRSSEFSTWIQWHQELDDRYGLKVANYLFKKAWDKRKPDSWTSNIDLFNRQNLITYLKSRGLQLDQNGLDVLTGWTYGIWDSVRSTFMVGKYIAIAVVVMVLILVFMLLFNLVRRPDVVAGAATKALL